MPDTLKFLVLLNTPKYQIKMLLLILNVLRKLKNYYYKIKLN